MILWGLPGCAHTDQEYDGTCSSVSCRVKKCFLFHHDKCSPHPYRSFEGYQTDLDHYVVKHAAKKCARQSLKTMGCNCKEKPSKAFRKGYQQAYIDIALGDSGEVPPVPPEEYWAAHYRTPQGYMEVQEWFTGYKLGAEHALADGRYDYNKIATPYSLSGWCQEGGGYWGENTSYAQDRYPIEPTPPGVAPTPHVSPHVNPAPQPVQPTAPHPLTLPAPPAPSAAPSAPPAPTHVIPQQKQTHTQPVLPPAPSQSTPPIAAPKPPIPMPKAIPAPKAKSHQPEIGKPAQPVYINDDPPPSPYKLQSFPSYTPLPGRTAGTRPLRTF